MLFATTLIALLPALALAQRMNKDYCQDGSQIINNRQCSYKCGVDYPGGDYRAVTATNFFACISACAADPQCTDATYSARNGYCYMKNQLTTVRGNSAMAVVICGPDQSKPSSTTPRTTTTSQSPTRTTISTKTSCTTWTSMKTSVTTTTTPTGSSIVITRPPNTASTTTTTRTSISNAPDPTCTANASQCIGGMQWAVQCRTGIQVTGANHVYHYIQVPNYNSCAGICAQDPVNPCVAWQYDWQTLDCWLYEDSTQITVYFTNQPGQDSGVYQKYCTK